jgi:hypothetical protein
MPFPAGKPFQQPLEVHFRQKMPFQQPMECQNGTKCRFNNQWNAVFPSFAVSSANEMPK